MHTLHAGEGIILSQRRLDCKVKAAIGAYPHSLVMMLLAENEQKSALLRWVPPARNPKPPNRNLKMRMALDFSFIGPLTEMKTKPLRTFL